MMRCKRCGILFSWIPLQDRKDSRRGVCIDCQISDQIDIDIQDIGVKEYERNLQAYRFARHKLESAFAG